MGLRVGQARVLARCIQPEVGLWLGRLPFVNAGDQIDLQTFGVGERDGPAAAGHIKCANGRGAVLFNGFAQVILAFDDKPQTQKAALI